MINGNSSKTGLMAVYNAAETTLVIDGVEMYGYQQGGNMVQIAWDNDKVTVETDSQGTSVASINNKDSATATVNLNQASPCNKKLMDLVNSNKEFALDYHGTTEHWYSPHCFISKAPDTSEGDTASGRAWQIHMLNATQESLLSEGQIMVLF